MSCPYDFVMTNHLNELSDCPPREPHEYDLQLVQLPLRLLMPDGALWRTPYSDIAAYQDAFDTTVEKMRVYLHMATKWNRTLGLPTFVANFLSPQQNSVGLLLPLYDIRNPSYFVSQLNVRLAEDVASYQNMYILDLDGLSSSLGKQYIQDDAVELESHASVLGGSYYDKDQERIERIPPMCEHYELEADQFFSALWLRILTMFRIIVRADPIKLVVIDLDNTLWRGIPAEEGSVDAKTTEGWPLGFMEALYYLKKRGIILAIASKNDEQRIRELWPTISHGRISLDDFAVVKINWDAKVANIQDILAGVNVLPKHTLFIDDNPVERAAVKEAYPDIRTLGTYPYYLKRILLWSAETQVPSISQESSSRTEMIQARVERESLRTRMTRDEFLKTLDISSSIAEINSTQHPQFARSFELINKTNQFNTTGRRWTPIECASHFDSGGSFLAFTARDRFSDYGLVGCAIIKGPIIEQLVMSCRVIGLDIEDRVISYIEHNSAEDGFTEIFGRLVETDANYPCRDLYQRRGFSATPQGWSKSIKNVVGNAQSQRPVAS